jgi:AraC-like ligand binding domain
MKEIEKIDLAHKFKLLHSVWDPRIAAGLNGQQIKIVKCTGPGDLLAHDEDVLYLVFKGTLLLVLKDQRIELEPGEMAVIPKNTPCRLAALRGAELIIFDALTSLLPANLNTDKTKLKKI